MAELHLPGGMPGMGTGYLTRVDMGGGRAMRSRFRGGHGYVPVVLAVLLGLASVAGVVRAGGEEKADARTLFRVWKQRQKDIPAAHVAWVERRTHLGGEVPSRPPEVFDDI